MKHNYILCLKYIIFIYNRQLIFPKLLPIFPFLTINYKYSLSFLYIFPKNNFMERFMKLMLYK